MKGESVKVRNVKIQHLIMVAPVYQHTNKGVIILILQEIRFVFPVVLPAVDAKMRTLIILFALVIIFMADVAGVL